MRTDPATGEAVFVATYGVHERDGTAYMNVGMPLPGGNFSAVLVPANAGAGLDLSSVADRRRARGDADLYLLVPRVGPVALPVPERFRVWPADDPRAPEAPDCGDHELTATHEMWLLGRPLLTVRYGLARDESAGRAQAN